MAVAGRLHVFINANVSQFTAGIRQVETQAKKLDAVKRQIATALAIPTAVFAGIAALTTRIAAAGAEIDDMAHRTGIARSTLQELSYIAGQTGTSMEGVAGALASFTRQLPQIAAGTGASARAMRQLGVSVKDASGQLRPMGDVFRETLSALAEMENETGRNALSTQIFGRRALELAPMIAAGGAEIERLTARAHELGLVMSDEAIASLAEYDDQMQEVRAISGAVARDFALGIIPAIQSVLPIFQAVATKFRELVGGLQLIAVDMTVFWEGKVPLFSAILRTSFGEGIAWILEKLAVLMDAIARIPGLGGAASAASLFRGWRDGVRGHFAPEIDHAVQRLRHLEIGAAEMRAEITGVGQAAEDAAGDGGGGSGISKLARATENLAAHLTIAQQKARGAFDAMREMAGWSTDRAKDPKESLTVVAEANAERFRATMTRASEATAELRTRLEDWATVGVDAFAGLITGATTFQETMKNVARAVIAELSRVVARLIAVRILMAFLPGGGTGALFSIGNVGSLGNVSASTLTMPSSVASGPSMAAVAGGGGAMSIDWSGFPRPLSPEEAARTQESLSRFAAQVRQHLAMGGALG